MNKLWIHGRFNECFAHDGEKMYGMIDDYECGIVEKVKGWLNSLGVEYKMTPDFTGCLMRQSGICEVDFRFDLD